jgi:protein JSN1
VIGGPENDVSSSSDNGKLGEALNTVKGAASVSTEQQLSAEGGGVENFRSPLVIDLVKAGVHEQVLEKGLAQGGVVSEQQMIMQVLSGGRTEEDSDVKAAAGESQRVLLSREPRR